MLFSHLCDEDDLATSLLDLLLGLSADVAGLDDDGDVGEAALAEELGVAEGKKVDDGRLVGRLGGEVLIALLSGDEGPELGDKVSKNTTPCCAV